jgi:hypothetical protein
MSISIINEILLTKGEAFTPTSISSTPDDQMIVTGSWVSATPGIAIKLNKAGEISWTYRWKKETLMTPSAADYLVGASVLPSGDILLCGNDAIGDAAEPRNPRKVVFKSQFIKLKADGTFIQEIDVSPKNTSEIIRPRIEKCGRWGEGAYAFGWGYSTIDTSGQKNEGFWHYLWIIKTDSQGKVVWERFIPTNIRIYKGFSTPQLLPDGNLVFAAVGNGKRLENGDNEATELVVMSPDGTVKAQRQLFKAHALVKRTTPEQPLIVAPLRSNSLMYLDESLATVKQHEIDKSVNAGFVHYLNGVNEFVVFSWSGGGGHTIRTVSKIDLTDGKVVQIVPGHNQDEYMIMDAVALNTHGTFAFVNSTTPSNEFAIGVTLIKLK